jgi:hypothetical protein
MSNTTTTNSRKTQPFVLYSVRDYEKNGEKKSDWTRIGVAFWHRDENGFDGVLDAIPLNGRFAARKSKPKSDQAHRN